VRALRPLADDRALMSAINHGEFAIHATYTAEPSSPTKPQHAIGTLSLRSTTPPTLDQLLQRLEQPPQWRGRQPIERSHREECT